MQHFVKETRAQQARGTLELEGQVWEKRQTGDPFGTMKKEGFKI